MRSLRARFSAFAAARFSARERTGAEVLALFRELYAQGNTVILVTHDPAIAGLANRRVELRDGLVHIHEEMAA